MTSAQFEVLMAVYQGDDPLKFKVAVESVFLNTALPCRLVLVVDGPVPAVLSSVIDGLTRVFPIRTVYLEKNLGLTAALNRGLEVLEADYFIRADADDVNLPHRFERLVESCRDEDVIGSYVEEVSDNETETGKSTVKYVPTTNDDIKAEMPFRNPFHHASVMVKREAVKAVGGYPEVYLREDYGLWVLLMSVGANFKNIPEVLVSVSAGNDLISRRGGWKYAKGELALQRLMVRAGVKGWARACSHGLLRMTAFLLPFGIRRLLYAGVRRFSYASGS